MSRKKNAKPYWEMTTDELREATKEFDEEFVFERTKPMSPEMKARWEAAKAKGDPPANGKAEAHIAVRIDKTLLKRCTALARKKRVSRDALMRMYIHHALRVLNENPDSTHVAACSKDNNNTRIVIDELIKHRQDQESLKAKVVALLPVPTVICDDPPPGRKH